MTEEHFKTLQRWFRGINVKLSKIETSMATKDDTDKLHGLIERVHRRIDEHLMNDDQEKRVFRLAIERLDEKVEALEEHI